LEPEPNPVEELKMMRLEKEEPEKPDYSNAPPPEYTIEDLVKMIILKNPGIEGGNEVVISFYLGSKEVIEKVLKYVKNEGLFASKHRAKHAYAHS
jgi:hypothetical protein